MNHWDVIIIGGGAAGLMCSIEAGKRGRSVLLIEHGPKLGRKIVISGGGRCNFTNLDVTASNYTSENPHFCKSALSRYTNKDFEDLVKQSGIRYHEKKLGQLFCDRSAKDILNMLTNLALENNVHLQVNTAVTNIKHNTIFEITTTKSPYTCESLVIATGGLSIPKMGASDFGYRVARQFDLNVTKTAPALDGFVLSALDQERFSTLSGVSLDVKISIQNVHFKDAILFTHKGLSGPAALQASLYWNRGDQITINLSPIDNHESFCKWLLSQRNQSPKMKIHNILRFRLPNKLVDTFTPLWLVQSRPIGELSNDELKQLGEHITQWEVKPESTVGYKKAEVTKGGVSTNELSSQTMESKKVPGLYFIGEVVDVTGWLGGFNFQWAWSSGWVAGQVA